MRSPTAESVFLGHPEIDAISAGLSKKAPEKVSEELLDWADVVFVMEKKYKNKIIEDFPNGIDEESIISLNIPDKYQYMDPELVSIFENRIPHILDL